MGVPEAIRLGPFVGGLNTASDPTSVQDNDLVICENLELDLDGALVNRPPILNIPTAEISDGDGVSLHILGVYTSAAGASYLLASDRVNRTWYFDGTSWVSISDTLAAHAMCQYRDKAWLIAKSGSGQTGGSWDPVSGFAAVPGMPTGSTIVANKERLWIGAGVEAATNAARITYSAVGEPNKWPDSSPSGGGYLNVNNGDGQAVVTIAVYFGDILIFKEHSCYRFTFSTDPGGGSLTRLSNTIGVSGQHCIAEYESNLYVLYEDRVYLLANFNFVRSNIKVNLRAKTPTTELSERFALSVWDDRLFVTYYDTNYVMSLRTNSWSTWVSDYGTVGRVVEFPSNTPFAYLHMTNLGLESSRRLFSISSLIDSTSEPMVCIARTKNYDYQSSHTFKKLAQWGADVVARKNVTGIVAPIVYATAVTWAQMRSMTWGQAREFTWGRPMEASISVVDPVLIGGTTGERKYIRFKQTRRFRQVYFEIQFETDGSITQAPAKLFSITTFVGSKQITPKQIN